MIYSRFLYTEFEQPHNDEGEGGYTIFSTPQSWGVYAMGKQRVGILNFAVLWDGKPDTRVIYLIEQAIVRDVMWPVKLVHASEGTLSVVYESLDEDFDREAFLAVWTDIGSEVQWDDWTVELIPECVVGQILFGGRLTRNYAPGIMEAHNLGISFYTEDMFLFKDDWSEYEMFGSEEQQDSDDEPPPNMETF